MKKNIICAAVLAAVAAASAAMILLHGTFHSSEHFAHIYKDDTLIQTIDLSKVEDPYSFTVGDPKGDHNVISVYKGSIAVTDASCPDKVCVHTGEIDSSLLPIVCLPNKLVIRIDGVDTDGVDAVTQ